ncbi:hypothetical protein JTP77_040950, partial [Streptomyces sp. S9]|nr:hypothetical protein [Streptomyces sp. S9]
PAAPGSTIAPVQQGAALTQTLFSQADSHAARTGENVQSVTLFTPEPAKQCHRPRTVASDHLRCDEAVYLLLSRDD